MGSYKVCIYFTRNFKVNEVEPPFDIKQTFSKFCDGGTLMNAEQLLRFLIEFQGETSATISDAEKIIHHVMHRRHHVSAFNRHVLTTEDFHQFLFSDDLNSPITNQVHHDMMAPLSHYFVYTGHNSYLTGNQLSSDCSDVPIIKALKRGVRVIELDLWPNLKGDNVNVLHGGTLTAPVSLLKCFKSIKEYAFSKSPYPVVITLEDHLTASLQAKVAEMATEIFGDMLFCPESDGLEEFPSPESLKYRIILSTKPPKEYLEAKKLKDRDASKYNHWSMELLDHSDGLSSDCEHIQDDDVDQSIHRSGQIRAPEYKRLGAIHVKNKNGESEVVKYIQDDHFYESGHESDQVESPECKTPTASPENEENSDGEVTECLQDDDVNEIKHNSSQTGPIQFKRLKAISAKKEIGDIELSEHNQDDNVNGSSESELSEIIRVHDVSMSKRNSGRVGAPEYKRLTALLVKKENGDSEVTEDIQVSDSEVIECIKEEDANEIRRNSVQTRAIEFKRLTAISAKKENGDSELAELIFDEDVNESSETELSELIQDEDGNEESFIEVQVGEPEYKRLMTILTRKENSNSDVSECIQEDDVNENIGFSDQVGVPEYKRLTAISAKSMDDDELSKFIQDHIVNEIVSKRLTAIHAKKENSDDENELIQDDVSIEIRCHADQEGAPDCVRLTAIPSEKKPTLLSELIQYDDVNESSPESEQVESPEYIQSTAKRKKGERKLCELIQEDFVNEKMQESGKVVPDYKRLIAIHARKIKGGMKESLKLDPTRVRRLSLSEQKLLNARSRHPTDLLRFTQRNILRVYPNGTRVDSSNYNPMTGWMYGAQMVAFNMQGYGKSLWLMQGMFRANGGCGYVKKPDILLHNQTFNPIVKLPVRKTLKVRLYMGDGWRLDYKQTYFDAYSPPDFYARVGIAGVPADVKMHKTKIMEDDWTPVWDKEFYFPLTVPELALLRVEVYEYDVTEKDDFGGQTCLPVWELRPGIRAVPLFSRKGEKLRSVKLLMQFQFA